MHEAVVVGELSERRTVEHFRRAAQSHALLNLSRDSDLPGFKVWNEKINVGRVVTDVETSEVRQQSFQG